MGRVAIPVVKDHKKKDKTLQSGVEKPDSKTRGRMKSKMEKEYGKGALQET